MVGCEGEVFSNHVLHYAASLCGARRSRLIAMVDTLGLPTVFFTHSASSGHTPGPAATKLFKRTLPFADWYFGHRIQMFSMLESLKPMKSGSGLSGNTVAALRPS